MKPIWILLLFLPPVLWSQVNLDFENGLLSGEGNQSATEILQVPGKHWDCDSVDAISGKYSLHHAYDNSGPGCDYLVLNHDPLVPDEPLSFSFRIRHGYSPSSANNWQVALLAGFNPAGITSEITSGIILGVNYKGSDDLVKLWRVEDKAIEEICTSALNYQEMVGTASVPFFRLTWHVDGELSLFYSKEPLVYTPVKIASCWPGIIPGGRSLVFRYEYSAAQDMKLWLDDIRLDGHFMADTIPPRIKGWSVAEKNLLSLHFSESIIAGSHSSFLLSGINEADHPIPGEGFVPDSLISRDSSLLLLFPFTIPNRESLVLSVKGVCDLDGNYLADTMVQVMRNEAVFGDLVFNEVMADPEPQVDLDLGEYLELYNRSEYTLNTEGWKMKVGDREYLFQDLKLRSQVLEFWGGQEPGPGLRLGPDQYCVITGIALPNEGVSLALYSHKGILLHAALYREPFDGPEWKKDGGWSLESPDPDLFCHTSESWEYSIDHSGGTPGRLNSTDTEIVDDQDPVLLYFGYALPGTIQLYYSEPVGLSGESPGQITIQPGASDADSVIVQYPPSPRLICYFPSNPVTLPEFKIHVPAVSDCRGNLSMGQVLQAGAVSAPVFGSVLINEIMYDPWENAPEYIELYNRDSRFFDLADLALGVGYGTYPEKLTILSSHSRILRPGEYLVLCRDTRHLQNAYGLEISGCWVGVDDLGSLPNTGGTIYLTERSGNTVDVADFGDGMHMEMMGDTRGISLERISWDKPGFDTGNWHSAASIEGYATPGRVNSQNLSEPEASGILVLEPKVFSPDNDGYNDLLGISLSTQEQGGVIRIWITDLSGNLVRSLANNHITGSKARYVWDGAQDSGEMVLEGIYVVHVRGYHPVTGHRWNKKAATGVIYP